MEPASIRITRFISSPDQSTDRFMTQRLVLEAHGVNIPSEVFVMHRGKGNTEEEEVAFEAVATPMTLESYPKSPEFESDDSGLVEPYYRTSRIELLFEHLDDLEETYLYILSDVQALVSSWNSLQRLQLSGSVILDGVSEVEADTSNLVSPVIETSLNWRPAGDPALSGGDQVILNEDEALAGWLPAGGAGPAGAVFVYNLASDPAAEIAINQSVEKPFPLISMNGVVLSEDIVRIQDGNIWWMYFSPGYSGFPLDGNAPWPLNYGGGNYPLPPKLVISNPV